MKKFWLFGLAALCLALWNSPVVAEDDKGSDDEDKPRKERKHDGDGEHRERRGDGENRKGGKHNLDLTEKQKEPFKAIMKARHEREKAFREQLRELGKSLGEMLKSEKPDESAIKSQLGKVRGLREKNQKDMDADRKKLESLLTTVQLAKLEMRELMHMGQKHGKGGKGGKDGKGGDRRRGDDEMGDDDHPRKHKKHNDEGEDEDRPRKNKHHDEEEE